MKKLIRILLAAVALLGLILGALELNVYVEKQEYRLEYPALIQQYSREYSLDPYLVAAVIHCESGNRPEAESPKGRGGPDADHAGDRGLDRGKAGGGRL